MAPEQMRNAEVDGRADVYSLAMMVYEMLTGVVPDDDGHDFMTLAMLRMRNDPPPMRAHDPSIPAALDEIVLAALSREPEERPAAARFGELLTQAVFPPEGKLPRVILSRTDGEGPSLVSSGEGPSLRSG